jgi:hypothetical protein
MSFALVVIVRKRGRDRRYAADFGSAEESTEIHLDPDSGAIAKRIMSEKETGRKLNPKR